MVDENDVAKNVNGRELYRQQTKGPTMQHSHEGLVPQQHQASELARQHPVIASRSRTGTTCLVGPSTYTTGLHAKTQPLASVGAMVPQKFVQNMAQLR